MIWNALLAGALALPGAGALAAASDEKQQIEVDDKDRLRAQQGMSRKLALQKLKPAELDGVKSYRVVRQPEGPGLDKPEQLRQVVAHMACVAAVFGLVELEDAKSFVGKDDVGIFTKYRFRILDDWRARSQTNGRKVFLVMHGGEAVHNGERYRAENPAAHYRKGEQYVLIAGTVDDEQRTIHDTPPFLEVSEGIVHPGPGWTPFAPGTALAQAKAQVADAVDREGCK
ncbi:hypothetical protein [Pseudoduganella flava]|nr:hypothetical protein [Pseudoduganella flava]QGZ39487.1 hypothetical protein GO485_10810 [Pseudoduganella flava]